MPDLQLNTPLVAIKPALEGEFIPNSNILDLQSVIQGPKVLLLGAGGAGKSHSLATLEAAGLEVACIFTEPSGLETLNDLTSKERFHWMYIPPGTADWASMAEAARKINTMSFKSLTELPDIDKRKYDHWQKYIEACGNFVCQRCGKKVGALDQLGPEWAVATDSLSGMNDMAMNMVVGLKPVKGKQDWGVAMDNLGRFVTTWNTSIKCLAVITGHLEKEPDEMTGGITLQAATLGQKLAPRIARFFSDIIMAKREGTKWSWSTTAFGADLKARNVGWSENIDPTFVPIVAKWHKRIGFELPKR